MQKAYERVKDLYYEPLYLQKRSQFLSWVLFVAGFQLVLVALILYETFTRPN